MDYIPISQGGSLKWEGTSGQEGETPENRDVKPMQGDVYANVGGHLKGQLGRGNDRSGKHGWLSHGVIQ